MTGAVIKTWRKSRRDLARLSARGADPESLLPIARGFVMAGSALTADEIPNDSARCHLAGTMPGFVERLDDCVLDLWRSSRRWQSRDAWDDAVDAALAELDARRRGLH
ncbi:MAG: hypothetical protein EOM91_22500 [Sphingobacteriia bacterium]|nr:hypothetical protein [Sphingobacteriia bacterium]